AVPAARPRSSAPPAAGPRAVAAGVSAAAAVRPEIPGTDAAFGSGRPIVLQLPVGRGVNRACACGARLCRLVARFCRALALRGGRRHGAPAAVVVLLPAFAFALVHVAVAPGVDVPLLAGRDEAAAARAARARRRALVC